MQSKSSRHSSILPILNISKEEISRSHHKRITKAFRKDKPTICRFDMEEGKITQKSVLLEQLMKLGSIEPLAVLREHGINRLGARIADLRSDGYDIVTEAVTLTRRITGRLVHFANYILRI